MLNEDAFGGRVLFDSRLMTKDSAAIQIDIDVKGLDCLFIKFDGKEEAIGDWGHARLVGSWDAHKVNYESSYIDSIIKQTELIPIRVNGAKDNRINIVIINRWEKRDERPYNNQDMRAEFLDDVNKSILAALTPGNPVAQTAYANYQQFFNLYALWWPETPEWKNGVDSELINAIRDRMFLPWADEHTGWVTFLLMPNRDGGGGGAARNLEDRVGSAVIVGNAIGKMLHEISHTCTSIGDEYTAGGIGTKAIPTYTASLEYERDAIKWKAWIDPETPMPTPYTSEYIDKIGAFEGAQYHLTNYFRPSAQGCIMGAGVFDNTEEMCAICEQRLSMRMYTLVYPIEDTYPAGKELFLSGAITQQFSVTRVHPEPDTQETFWILNGEVIASGVDDVVIDLEAEREYELVFTLRDTTSFIREDPPFGEFPYRERRWLINTGADEERHESKYTFTWTDTHPKHETGLRYEAEAAGNNMGQADVKQYFGASEQAFVKLGEKSHRIDWDITVLNKDSYSLGIVFASAQKGPTNLELWANDELLIDNLVFPATRPMYTGWDMVKFKALLHPGGNKISLKTKNSNLLNVDYLWVPEQPLEEIRQVVEVKTFIMADIHMKRLKTGGVELIKPNPDLEYVWYADNPVFREEKPSQALGRGIIFHPEKRGNYFLAGVNKSTGAVSSNRMGFYYSEGPEIKSKSILPPDKTKTANLLLWLDASDIDGDGEVDNPAPSRDPNKNWKDKALGIKGPFIKYKPNQLNGMGVAGFEMVWLTNIEKPVTNFQTVIMVYKESSMSFAGSSPFTGLSKLIGRAEKPEEQLFDQGVSDLTKKGTTYLNGQEVNPFRTPNPMDYCILTVEFASKVQEPVRNTHGYWEGSLAEMLVFDGILSEKERIAVEAGLQKKWFSLK